MKSRPLQKEIDKLSNPRPSFLQFLRQSPLVGIKLKITRDRSLARKVDL
jgi:hypothetical protein